MNDLTRIRTIVHSGDRVLLLHHNKDDEEYWSFPGGGKGGKGQWESMEEYATRGLMEQTGITTNALTPSGLVYFNIYQGRDMYKHVEFDLIIYFAQALYEDVQMDDQHDDFIWVTRESVVMMLRPDFMRLLEELFV